MNLSDNGLHLIEQFEGTVLHVYLDSVNKPTVGVGHLIVPADNLKLGDTITQQQADDFLRSDVASAERAVNALNVPLTQNQFDALVSFTFNLGAGGLRQLVKQGMAQVPSRLLLFDHAGGKVVKGLTNRRKAERSLYLTP